MWSLLFLTFLGSKMKYLKILFLVFILATNYNAYAKNLQHYCKNIVNKHNPANEASLLKLISVDKGIAKVLVIGFPKTFRISLNDIDARSTKFKEKDFKCNYKNVGSIMYFDLNKLHMNAAYLSIKADSLTIQQSLTFD